MTRTWKVWAVGISAMACALFSSPVMAQDQGSSQGRDASSRDGASHNRIYADKSDADASPMRLAQYQPEENDAGTERSYQSTETTSVSEDAMTEEQSLDSYCSLEDGQPGEPGHFELKTDIGWQTKSGEHDPVLLTPELTYTFDGSEFLRNMELGLSVPMELGLGGEPGNGDVEIAWLQRWVREDGMMPTISTVAEIRVPSGYHSSGVDGTLTGVIAKNLGPGTMFLNGFIKTANGHNIDDLRHFQWGARAGYKWQVRDDLAFIVDYVNQSSEEEGNANSNLLELSSEWRVNEHLTIGPGIVIGLDDNEETPNLGAGVHVGWSF